MPSGKWRLKQRPRVVTLTAMAVAAAEVAVAAAVATGSRVSLSTQCEPNYPAHWDQSIFTLADVRQGTYICADLKRIYREACSTFSGQSEKLRFIGLSEESLNLTFILSLCHRRSRHEDRLEEKPRPMQRNSSQDGMFAPGGRGSSSGGFRPGGSLAARGPSTLARYAAYL